MKKHPGIRIDKIPVGGAAGLILAVGVLAILLIGLPVFGLLLLVGLPVGAACGVILYWWRNRSLPSFTATTVVGALYIVCGVLWGLLFFLAALFSGFVILLPGIVMIAVGVGLVRTKKTRTMGQLVGMLLPVILVGSYLIWAWVSIRSPGGSDISKSRALGTEASVVIFSNGNTGTAPGVFYNPLMNPEHELTVRLIEASIQRGEDPDWLMRELASEFPQARGFYLFEPLIDLFTERKSWEVALSMLELWETHRIVPSDRIQAKRGFIYLLSGRLEEARRIHDELIASCKTGEICQVKPREFFDHFGSQFKMPQLIAKSYTSYFQKWIQRELLCSVVVEVDGSISDPRVIKGLGYGRDEAALRELQQWRLAPGTLNGEPIRVQATIEVTFHLPVPEGTPDTPRDTQD